MAVHLVPGRTKPKTSRRNYKVVPIDAGMGRQYSKDMRLVLKGVDIETFLSVPISGSNLTVGRSSKKSSPDVDLHPLKGQDYGVSRLHAAFSLRDGELYVEDLRSTNGTLINGFEIPPERPFRLRHGDEIEFGRLRMTVSVVRVPSRK